MTNTLWKCEQFRAGQVTNKVLFDTEAQARIMNGKVEKWTYTGSGEVVP